MKVPDPRELLTAVPRIFGLLEAAEDLLSRAGALVDDIDRTNRRADAEVTRVDSVVDAGEVLVRRIEAVVDRVDPLVARLAFLLDQLEPSLTRLQPTLVTLSETTDPAEVAALVRMVDHLPELTQRLEQDVLPIMGTLGTVAPDLRDLLTVSTELNEMLGKLPGLGRIKRRVEQEHEDTDP